MAGMACGAAEERAARDYATATERFNANDLDGAARALDAALQADSSFAVAHLMQGKIHFYRQNYEQARISFERAAECDGDLLDAVFWQARTRMMKNDSAADDEALSLLERIIRADSAHVEAWYAKGLLHQKRGQTDAAIAAYKSGLQSSGKIALIYLQLGGIYQQARLPDEANRYFTRALALSADPELRQYIEAVRKRAPASDPAAGAP